jgi:hypothetical protein
MPPPSISSSPSDRDRQRPVRLPAQTFEQHFRPEGISTLHTWHNPSTSMISSGSAAVRFWRRRCAASALAHPEAHVRRSEVGFSLAHHSHSDSSPFLPPSCCRITLTGNPRSSITWRFARASAVRSRSGSDRYAVSPDWYASEPSRARCATIRPPAPRGRRRRAAARTSARARSATVGR